MKKIFKETLHKGLKQEVSISKIITDKNSKYQRIQIFDTPVYGRVLVLDKCDGIWCKVKSEKFKGWIKTNDIWGSTN